MRSRGVERDLEKEGRRIEDLVRGGEQAAARVERSKIEYAASAAAEARLIDDEEKRLEREAKLVDAEEEGLSKWFEEQDMEWHSQLQRTIREEEHSIAELERSAGTESGSLGRRKDELRAEFESLRERVARSVVDRASSGDGDFAQRLKELLSLGKQVARIAEVQVDRQRVRTGIQDLRSRAYESWLQEG